MKIALISDYPIREIGGVESYCFHLIKEVTNRDNNIEFFPINISNIKHKFFKKLNLYIYSKKELRERISQCDIVHINGLASYPSMQAIDIARCLGKRIICTSHYHPSYALSRPLLGELFYKLIVLRRLKHIDKLIAINKEEYELLHSKVKSCSIIPHWINSEDYHKTKIESNRDNAILFVGKVFKKHKRADFMHHVPDHYKVWYVSSQRMEDEKPNFVQFCNLSNKELSSLYEKATCLIVPSKYEAFSFVVLEALLKGTPVLISDRVRIADFLPDNKLVHVFEYDNEVDFKTKLSLLLSNNISHQERVVSVEKVMNIFNPNVIIGDYLKLYHSIHKY